jgi:hypothetical protein
MPARTATKPDVLVCTHSFVGFLKGVEVACREGEVLAADDPVVRNWPEFFMDPAGVRRSSYVEQATAAPGETREGKAITTDGYKGR